MQRILLILASLAALVTFAIDIFSKDIAILGEGVPNFEGIYLLRTALIVLSSSLFVLGVVNPQSPRDVGVISHSTSKIWSSWGGLTWSIEDPVKQDKFLVAVKELIVWAVLLLSVSFVVLFLYSPAKFTWLGVEDNLIETLSALLWLITCGVSLFIYRTLRRTQKRKNLFYIIIPLAFAFICFFIGMEEISWFQRVFSFATPKAFEGNLQNEFNLHNFETSKIENAYYVFSFLFLILLPFIKDLTSSFRNYKAVDFFLGSRFLLFVSVFFAAYNYDMWNIIYTQFIFFITLFILIYYAGNRRLYENTFLSPMLLIVYGLTQVVFLASGSMFLRSWDVTEYKELLIPLSFVFYSLEILQKANKLKHSGMQYKNEQEEIFAKN